MALLRKEIKMKKVIEWLDRVWSAALLITIGLAGLLWWSNKNAVNSYKDNIDEEANTRGRRANDAAADAMRLSPSERAERMRSKGWWRD